MIPAKESPATVEYPTTDLMEPELARYLFENHCAILVLEDLPEGSEIGIDLSCHRVGNKFRGIKLIPPGVHVIYASAISETNKNQAGPRCGFFHDFKPKELFITRWSVEDEEFDIAFQPDEEYRRRYSLNLRDLDSCLGPYAFSTYNTYRKLSNKISPEIMRSLVPDCKIIRCVPYLVYKEVSGDNVRRRRFTNRLSDTSVVEQDPLPNFQPSETTEIKFTSIPETHLDSKKPIPSSSITEYNLDSTMKLDQTFEGSLGRTKLLAEFQFAFMTLIFIHVYDCFEHWKTILALVCGSRRAITKYPSFFREFLEIIAGQLLHIPEDLFTDICDQENFLRHHLDNLLQNLNEIDDLSADLIEVANEVRRIVESKFSWQFDIENEDERPVVVEL